MSSPFTRCVFYPMPYQKAMFIVRRIFVLSNLFQLAATDSNRPTNCMRFSGTRSQTFHSMTSSAITKSGSSSRLSHRVVNTVASDDAVDISVQTDQEQLPQPIQIEPQGNHITIGVPHSPRMHANLPCVCVCLCSVFLAYVFHFALFPHIHTPLTFTSIFSHITSVCHRTNGNRGLLKLPHNGNTHSHQTEPKKKLSLNSIPQAMLN